MPSLFLSSIFRSFFSIVPVSIQWNILFICETVNHVSREIDQAKIRVAGTDQRQTQRNIILLDHRQIDLRCSGKRRNAQHLRGLQTGCTDLLQRSRAKRSD